MGDASATASYSADDRSTLELSGHSAEDSLEQRLGAINQPNMKMLQMENAALIDGLRALNEQVQKLEAERNRLLEAGSRPGHPPQEGLQKVSGSFCERLYAIQRSRVCFSEKQ